MPNLEDNLDDVFVDTDVVYDDLEDDDGIRGSMRGRADDSTILSEESEDALNGILGEEEPEDDSPLDPDDLDYTNNALQRMNERGAKGKKICDISCISGGVLGTAGIGLCTVAALTFFMGVNSPFYAIEFPNGANVGAVTSYVDENGRTNYDIELDRGGNGSGGGNGDTASADASDPNDPDASKHGANGGNGSDSDNPGGNTPGGNGPGQGGSGQGDSDSDDPNGQGGSKPGMPDTGEPTGELVTPLMESELLRSQASRIENGGDRYLESDISIPLSDSTIESISNEYGFSEDFILAYNDIGGYPSDIIRLPDIQ